MNRHVIPCVIVAVATVAFAGEQPPEGEWTACPSEIATVKHDIGDIQSGFGLAQEAIAAQKWELAALRYKQAIEAGGSALSHVKPWNREYAPAYAQILDTILSATNRVQGLTVEAGTNDYETVRAIFQTLPPRKAEEPNQSETWAYDVYGLKRELAWVPRERDWLTNYVATAGDRFSFIPIRDRLEGHLARAEEIRNAAALIQRLFDRANMEHFALCTNRVDVEYHVATNRLATERLGNDIIRPFFILDRMMTPMNKDRRFDESLSKVEEVWTEYYRAKINEVAQMEYGEAGAYVNGFISSAKKLPLKGWNLKVPEEALEYAGLAVEFSKSLFQRGQWFLSLQMLRHSRDVIVPHVPKDGDNPTEVQQAFKALLDEVDETERQLIADRFRIEYGEAVENIGKGEYVRARRPLNRLPIFIGLANKDGRYNELLTRLDDLLEETHRMEDAAREERNQKGSPFQ